MSSIRHLRVSLESSQLTDIVIIACCILFISAPVLVCYGNRGSLNFVATMKRWLLRSRRHEMTNKKIDARKRYRKYFKGKQIKIMVEPELTRTVLGTSLHSG